LQVAPSSILARRSIPGLSGVVGLPEKRRNLTTQTAATLAPSFNQFGQQNALLDSADADNSNKSFSCSAFGF
jgi:hypothetical protein